MFRLSPARQDFNGGPFAQADGSPIDETSHLIPPEPLSGYSGKDREQ